MLPLQAIDRSVLGWRDLHSICHEPSQGVALRSFCIEHGFVTSRLGMSVFPGEA
jgi:hypothetical protein